MFKYTLIVNIKGFQLSDSIRIILEVFVFIVLTIILILLEVWKCEIAIYVSTL